MDTLHAPGARTPFGHGAGGRVWQGRREEERAGMEDGLFWEEDGLLAHDCEFRSERAGLCPMVAGIFGIFLACVCGSVLSM